MGNNEYGIVIQNILDKYNNCHVPMLKLDDDVKQLAKDWYEGEVDDVHKYYIFNGKNKIYKTRKGMGLVKTSSETIANLLLNEKCDVVLSDGDDKQLMDNILHNLNFWTGANKSVELGFALGYAAWVEGVAGLKVNDDGSIINDGTGLVTWDYVDNSKVMPLMVENGAITDCAFVKENTKDVQVSVHCLDRRKESKSYGTYIITNVFISKVDDDRSIEKELTIFTGSENAWFQLIQPNLINNDELGSPIGIPFWWNAQDALACIDCAYDSLDSEIRNGKRRTYIKEDLLKRYITKDGTEVEPFDPNDADFYYVPSDSDSDSKNLIYDEAPQLRVQEMIAALNMHLNVYSSKIGFGENFYNYEAGKRVMTATQVISENGQLFRTIKKHEILLEKALVDFFKSIIYITNTFTENKFGEAAVDDVSVKFDDSIIEDKAAEKINDRADVASGSMSNVEYRMKWFAETEEDATKKVAYMDIAKMYDTLATALNSGLLTPDQFVVLVKDRFPKINTDGLAEYVTSNLNSQANASMENPLINFASEM